MRWKKERRKRGRREDANEGRGELEEAGREEEENNNNKQKREAHQKVNRGDDW